MGLIGGLFSRRRKEAEPVVCNDPFDLSYPVLKLSPHDTITLGAACEGIQVLGATGSGKTSGPGDTICCAYMAAQMGFLVLTAKQEDCARMVKLAKKCGRDNSVAVFSPSEDYRFNVLDWIYKRPGPMRHKGAQVVDAFMAIHEATQRGEKDTGGNAKFFELATRSFLRNAVDLCTKATGQLSVPMLHEIAMSAPQTTAEVHDEAWQASSRCYQLIVEHDAVEKSPEDEREFKLTATYWLREHPSLPPDTRGSIIATFSTIADPFMRGDLHELFCTTTNIVPEVMQQGAIVIIDLPAHTWREQGIAAQTLWKYVTQISLESRDLAWSNRPVCIWADEAHLFVTEHDAIFQSTARSMRTCTVYLTQSLNSYYSVLGGERGKAKTEALLNNLQYKIFCQNGDTTTNKYAADLFGKHHEMGLNFSASRGQHDRTSGGGSDRVAYKLEPEEFSRLAKGGVSNGLIVESIIYGGGYVFKASNDTFLRVGFRQG